MSVRGPALTRIPPPAFSRLRLGAIAAASLLHVGALGAIALMPPEALERFVSTGDVIEVRFFTISASDAESDLPLNAPLLADRLDAAAQAGTPEGEGTAVPDPASAQDAEPEAEPADDTAEEATPEPDAETARTDVGSPPVSETGTLPADPDAPAPRPTPPRARPQPGAPSASLIPPDVPVDTIQPTEEEAARTTARLPTFAEIEARADMRLRPEDFQVGQVDGSVGAVIAEVLCLSSGEANREAGGCGNEPNAAQAELALYRIQAMSEGPLQFAENMSRLEFELAQLGASASTLELLRVHFLNAQREQARRSPLLRAMDRDGAMRTDHLGITRPITPQRALDPSGER